MAHTPTDMDGFLPLLTTQDTKAKLTIGAKLHTYLCKVLPSPGEGDPSIECSDIGLFIDSLLPWVTSSNHKLSLLGLDILITLCEKMGAGDFKPFVSAVLPMIIDRLGDSKEPIREKSQAFLLKLMETDCVGVQYLFDRLTSSGFSHKNAHVREQCLKCLDATLVTHGTRALTISKLVPHIVKLLSDPHASVRDAAFSSLVVIYKFVGDRLKLDLTKKYPVPANKLAPLLAKFEDIKLSGELEPAASLSESLMFEDEVDRARSNSLKRSTLQSLNRKAPPAAKGPPEDFNSNSLGRLTRTNSLRKPMSAASSDAGGVSEDYFERAYDDVPQVVIFSSRDVEDHFSRLRTTLADTAQDWSRRVEALKKVRALVMAAPQWEELAATVRGLEQPLETCVKDLRSQVVREACITIAYLSRHLGSRFDHTAEALLPSLIALIPNSAKVISTSSHVALRLILSHTHYPRLIPVIARSLNSKSKDIRRACCEFVELILKTWQTATLERQVGNLQEVIKKGIADADPEARVVSRKAYWSYVDHWPDQGEALLNALDPVYKRALMSNSSSTNSLSRSDGISTRAEGYSSRAEGYSSRADSISSRADSYSSRGGDGVSSSSAGLSRRHYGAASTNGGPAPAVAAKPVIQPRSSSAIDLQAVQRAKVRAQYAALARQKVAVGSLPRSRKNSVTELTPDKERAGRTRSRVSMSTPTSRSGSPSSRLSYSSYSPQGGGIPRPRRGSSGIPRSTDTSRESSPSRYKLLGSRAGSMGGLGGGGGGGGRPPRPTTIMAAKILQASREAESALADALDNPELSRSHPRRGFRGLDDHSDESETSSLCSEVSFDSACVPRRASDSYSSWNGSQSRIYRDICESTPKDIGEIISNCESTHWNDRKDGLVNLQCYLQAGNLLSPLDLKRITDIFTKMFMDSHTKVFSLFLDCFNELIVSHHQELHAWLYLLISRLLNKQGADLLGSVHSKILRSLDVVRDSFPPHLQLQAAFRFLSDPTQTPNTKVKLATLGYVMKLATITDPALAFPLPAQGGKDFATLALSKLIGWTRGENLKQTPGGGSAAAELRRAAQETIVALFNLNTPQITFRFSLLPQEYQEAAATLITTRVRKSSAAGATETTGKSPSHPGGGGINNNNGFSSLPSSPRLGSPHAHESRVTAGYHTGTPGGYQSGAPPGGYHSLENAENLNPEEIYRSLRRTTAEIVKLSGGGGGAGDSERGDSVSYDSGISQMSAPGPEDNNSSTTLRERTENNIKDGFGLQRLLDGLKESEKKPVADRKQLLSKLHECVQVNTSGISLHFKGLLYQLLSLSEDPEPQVREYAITILNAMLKKSPLLPLFASYIELVVLKVINRSKDTAKDVYKACETCALSIAVHLPPEKVTRILFPLIVAEEHPINLVAIKMLTKVIEVHGHGSVEQFLPNIMPALLQAYENEDSCVRKCAVFCMVALHREMGEARLAPYILKLSGAKLKLLQLYIKRSQSHSASSVPTSPKSNM